MLEWTLFCRLAVRPFEDEIALVRLDVLLGPLTLGAREDASETELSSLAWSVVGMGKGASAELEAVRRRCCGGTTLRVAASDFVFSAIMPMMPLSSDGISSISLLVSLFATLTATSASPLRKPGVTGDGRGEARSVAVGDVGWKSCRGENSVGVGRV